MRSSLDPSASSARDPYDEHLIQCFLNGDADEQQNAVMTLWERHSPGTFDEALALVAPPRRLTARQERNFSKAWDLYWQVKDRPEN